MAPARSGCLMARLRAFRDNRSGSMFVFMAVLLIPLIAFFGLAIDAGRGYLLKSRMGDALDSAGLAAAMVANDPVKLQADFEKYFNSNFPAGYLGAQVTLNPAVFDNVNETVTLSASATLPTTLMRVLGHETMSVASATEVTRRSLSLDLMLSMDMSGSMGWSDGAGSTRIVGARNAATTLVGILFGQASNKNLLKIGLVPWNGKVNITDGASYNQGLTTTVSVPPFTNPLNGNPQSVVYYANNSPVPLLSNPPAGWQGCVYARYLNDGNSSNDADTLLGPVSVNGTDWPGWQRVGPEGEPKSNGGTCKKCTACQNRGVTRLTSDRPTIEAAINNLTNPGGVTNIVQGLAWAYRALSPGEPFNDASANPGGNHERAILLLTDGQHWGAQGDAYNGAFGSGNNAGANGLDQRLTDLATYIKSQGIRIYVIQFYYNSGPLASLLQSVATDTAAPYYFFAPDSSTLNTAFQEVANHLSDLRLSK